MIGIALVGPLQSHEIEPSMVLIGVVVLAGVGTGILFLGSILACRTRPELRYILIMLAVGALFTRSLVGMATIYGVVPMNAHHVIEHSLDFLIAALVLYAVYRSKPGAIQPAAQGRER